MGNPHIPICDGIGNDFKPMDILTYGFLWVFQWVSVGFMWISMGFYVCIPI